MTTLVDRYDGKRLNSPNDLVFKSNGDLYFTDPPFGLPKAFDDPAKELPFQGVYRLARDGRVTLLSKEAKAPNGIGFSPGESKLYVADSGRALWFVFDVQPDGTLGPAKVFFDGSELAKDRPGVADSLRVDVHGNIFGAAPGGIWIIAPDGKLLGRFELGTATGNCAWGEDGSTLFIASNSFIYRIRLTIKGAGTTVAGFSKQTRGILVEMKTLPKKKETTSVTNEADLLTALTFVRAPAASAEDLKRELLSTTVPTRAEPGNLKYDLYQSPNDTGSFLRLEVWRNAAALEEHKQTPPLKASFERRKSKGWTTEITTWKRVDEARP